MGRRKARVTDLVLKFYQAYKKLWEEKYEAKSCVRLNRATTKRIKDLISDLRYSELLDRVERYFETDDKWLLKKHHPLPVFFASIDDYAKVKGNKNGKGKKIQAESFDVASELRNNK